MVRDQEIDKKLNYSLYLDRPVPKTVRLSPVAKELTLLNIPALSRGEIPRT